MDLSGIGAVAAAGVAIAALVVALLARDDSKKSADAAAVSARAAESALELERDEVARATEVSDVAWQMRASTGGGVEFVNDGSAVAYDVAIVLNIGRRRADFTTREATPGAVLSLPETSNVQQLSKFDGEMVALVPHGEGGYSRVRISARVAWRSKLGTPGIQLL